MEKNNFTNKRKFCNYHCSLEQTWAHQGVYLSLPADAMAVGLSSAAPAWR